MRSATASVVAYKRAGVRRNVYSRIVSDPVDIASAYFIDRSIWNLADINAILAKCGLETIDVPE